MKTTHPARPEWIAPGATVYRVTAGLDVEPCTVLERFTKAGTLRVKIVGPADPLPWTASIDQVHETAAAAWWVAARELDRRAVNAQRDAAELFGRSIAAYRNSHRAAVKE